MNKFIPSSKQIAELRWDDYVPPSKEEVLEGASTRYLHGWHGEKNGMYGKTNSDKQKEAAAKKAKEMFTGVPKWYKTTPAVLIGTDNPRAQAVLINDIVYDTLKQASEATNIHRTTISHRCKSSNPKFINYRYV